jgi:thiol:disulfide interchange protein DsbC
MKPYVLILLGAISVSACAQSNSPAVAAQPGALASPSGVGNEVAVVAGTPAARARDAVHKVNPQISIDQIEAAPIAGFQQVIVGGQVVYVSNDGRYLIQGTLMELATRDNLTAASEAVLRRAVLDAVPRDRRIIFAPANPKYRVTVFTDIDCTYCRKLHSQIADYNKAGIAIEYLIFPRSGPATESITQAINVWCAGDRRKALTDAKLDRPVAKKTCANPIAMDYELGRKIGIDGTPAIYAADGTQLGGYLPPAEMLARLDRQAGKAVAAK